MKLYTDKSQTAKLIELGFDKPKHTFTFKLIEFNDVKMDIDIPVSNYSIGELLSFLPKSIEVNDLFFTLCIHSSAHYWIVEYADISFGTQARLHKEELIDALFAEIVALKEEKII